MSDAPQTPPPAATDDNTICGLAYLTFIPAIIFLASAPYNTKPIVKFHAWQELGLSAIWLGLWILHVVLTMMTVFFFPVAAALGIVFFLVFICLFIVWLIAMIQAFQGKRFNIPVLSGFAAKQAGL